jgi:hypothetical protein
MYGALARLRTILARCVPLGRRGRTITIIARANLFDPRWYLSQNPEVTKAAIDPLVHYIDHGAWEGRDPHPLFDTDWYLSNNPDVARTKINPLAHYIAHGAKEGRDPHPLFDTGWYLSKNPDAARVKINPLAHYIAHATQKGRNPHPLFDTDWYVSNNPDVAAQQVNPLVHYLVHGAIERRNPHPLFDSDWYFTRNRDIVSDKISPLAHYVVQGAREGRDPHPLFDSDWYLSQNPDVATAKLNPLAHYVTHGALELRDPHPLFSAIWYRAHNRRTSSAFVNPLIDYLSSAGEGNYPHPLFDTHWYLVQNPDVALAQISPLLHYILHGAAETRDPNPLFDTDWYLSEDPDVAAANINPLSHYVLEGAVHGRQPNWSFDTASYYVLHPDAAASGVSPLAHCLSSSAKAQQRRDAAFAAVKNAFDGLAEIEPELCLSINHSNINNLKYVTGHSKGIRFFAWRKLLTSIDKVYDRVIFVPSIDLTENDSVALDILRAARQLNGHDATLLIAADDTNLSDRHTPPTGISTRTLSNLHPNLTVPDRVEITTALIYHLQPGAVLNLNSLTLWRTIEERGAALARVTRLYAYVLDRTRTPHGRISGLTDRYFRSCFPYLTRTYVDSAALPELLVDTYGVPDNLRERFRALYRPLRTAVTVPQVQLSSPDDRASACCVLWRTVSASDVTSGIILKVAQQCPDIIFDVYVCGESNRTGDFLKDTLVNLRIKGSLESIDGIQLDQYFAVLYATSQEGLPHILVEAASRGLPVIAPMIGGICELIDDETGWPIGGGLAALYVKALAQIRRDPVEVARRVSNMLTLVRSRHTWERYLEALLQPPSFLEG